MRPDRLVVGDLLQFGRQVREVAGAYGGRVALLDSIGATEQVAVITLLSLEDAPTPLHRQSSSRFAGHRNGRCGAWVRLVCT